MRSTSNTNLGVRGFSLRCCCPRQRNTDNSRDPAVVLKLGAAPSSEKSKLGVPPFPSLAQPCRGLATTNFTQVSPPPLRRRRQRSLTLDSSTPCVFVLYLFLVLTARWNKLKRFQGDNLLFMLP
ncbi:uncharacterized protein ACOB8E_018982 isoform 1-T3 [Sarcophilus harrisii]